MDIPQPSTRDNMTYALVNGAAAAIAHSPERATEIAEGIKRALDVLYPAPSPMESQTSAGPRVTPADIEAEIASEHYFTAADGYRSNPCYDPNGHPHEPLPAPAPLELLTFCVLVLRNGFTVTGESACASPENFNAEIGRRVARENAVQKIWPLMGYELRSKLAQEG